MSNADIFVHRGINQPAPENSIPACRAALDRGFSLEVDVRCTADGEFVVTHDNNLKETAGVDCLVSEIPLNKLRQIRIRDDSNGREYKIPTLSEVLALFADEAPAEAQLALHLKGQEWGEMTEQLVEALSEYERDDTTIRKRAFLFDVTVKTAKLIKEVDPSVRIGLSVAEPIRFPSAKHPTIYTPKQVFSNNCWDIVWADEWVGLLYTRDFIDMCRSAGKSVICVSPELHNTTEPSHPQSNSPSDVWRRLLDYGVDGICTDLPSELANVDS